ncbi:hypothetical protein M8J77_000896 [Diaphorina citri]|nr:hypothetical protein M8J77_000896 [Diaphorina citri]
MPRPEAFRYKFVCNVCTYGTYLRQALKNHILSHTGEKPYACMYCSYTCGHQNSNSSVRYNCSHCGVYSTLLLDEMILHCKTCTSMPRPDAFRCKFVCNVCPYGAYSNQAIRNHILSHTGEKPYACSYCSYACAHKNASSKRHVNYSCKHCGSFSTYDIDVMVEHCRLCPSMHRPDAFKFKFVCYECNYGAYQTAMIKGHIWSHTGEKPFACNFYIFKGHPLSCLHCKDFMTTDFDQLIQHCKFCAYMPRPNPYKCKYVCYQCNYSSYHIIPFKGHVFQHIGAKPYKCRYCPFASTIKSNIFLIKFTVVCIVTVSKPPTWKISFIIVKHVPSCLGPTHIGVNLFAINAAMVPIN